MIKNSFIKIDNSIIIFYLIIFFLSSVINNYIFPTFFLIETFCLISLLLITYKRHVFTTVNNTSLIFLTTFGFFLIFYGVLLSQFEFDAFTKESYRFLTIPLLFFCLAGYDLNFKKIFNVILILSNLYIIYNLYELIQINIINPGNIHSEIFGGAIINYFKEDTNNAYFRLQDELIIPFFRPFGLWLQPQKSAFLFPIAIVVHYIYKRDFSSNEKLHLYQFLLLFSTIITGAKTAILTSVILIYIIKVDFLKKLLKPIQLIFLFISIILSAISIFYLIDLFKSEYETTNSILIELKSFFNLPIFNILFGLGFIGNNTYIQYGFTGETYIVRLCSQIGIIFFIIYFYLLFTILIKKINKISVLIIALIFNMILHYAIVDIYFFNFIICIILHYNLRLKY